MVDMFDPHKADLRGTLNTNQQLFVSAAHHKAFIIVNEDGSEAAAACKVISFGWHLITIRCMQTFYLHIDDFKMNNCSIC